MERFYRTERLLGKKNSHKLNNARVAVIGLGAVGGYAVEGLARLGIGSMLLIDHDSVSATNINRQLYALESTVGTPKATVAATRIADINPEADITALQLFIDTEQHSKIIEWKPDIVVDAIDSLTPKAELLAGMYHASIPIVSSMGAALRRDPAQIRTGDIFDTRHCPLARKIRSMLKKRDVGRGIECVYSLEIPDFDFRPPEEEDYKEAAPTRGRQRNILGSLATLTGIFGLTLAHITMEKLLIIDK